MNADGAGDDETTIAEEQVRVAHDYGDRAAAADAMEIVRIPLYSISFSLSLIMTNNNNSPIIVLS